MIATTCPRHTAAILMAALAMTSGCMQLPFSKAARESKESARLAKAKAEPIPQAPKELLPHDAAQVCRATAEQLEQNGRAAEAIDQYLRARRFDPDLEGIAHHLAVLYDRAGDHERALPEYRRAIQESPKNADLWNDYGYFEYEREDYAAAEKHLRRALELAPKHPRAAVNLGLTLAEQGKYDDAQVAFEKAVSPAAAQHNLGIILARHGKTVEAAELLHAAAAADPTLKPTQAVLAQWDDQAPAIRRVSSTDEE